jgi:hypothetical protein
MAQFWSSILIPRYATGRCLWIILQLSWDKTQGVTSVYSGASTKPQLWSATPCSKAAKRGLLSQWRTRNGLWSNWGQIHARAAVLANCLEGCLLVVLQELRLLILGTAETIADGSTKMLQTWEIMRFDRYPSLIPGAFWGF